MRIVTLTAYTAGQVLPKPCSEIMTNLFHMYEGQVLDGQARIVTGSFDRFTVVDNHGNTLVFEIQDKRGVK